VHFGKGLYDLESIGFATSQQKGSTDITKSLILVLVLVFSNVCNGKYEGKVKKTNKQTNKPESNEDRSFYEERHEECGEGIHNDQVSRSMPLVRALFLKFD